MSDSFGMAVLAIDGGGTRCRIALGDGRSVTSVEVGAANVSTDFGAALREIDGGLDALAARAGLSRAGLAALPAFIGLAGVTGDAMIDRLHEALPFAKMKISDDRPAALRGALGDADGVIAHCGTGSFFAAQSGARIRLMGGWGSILGDEASAHWIGRAALSLTLEVADGRFDRTPLAEHLLAAHGGTAGIVRFARDAGPSEFGAIAPEVTRRAVSGDALALRLMGLGAGEITRALGDIGWRPGQTVCLTGGIGPSYASYLPAAVQACLTPPAGDPLAGALSLARDFAREVVHERG